MMPDDEIPPELHRFSIWLLTKSSLLLYLRWTNVISSLIWDKRKSQRQPQKKGRNYNLDPTSTYENVLGKDSFINTK
jgi:hypothetical protein